MFHVSEACDGKGVLTVENGQMTIHVSLASRKILNLYPGSAEDAQKDGAQLLEPTVDEVTYSDGLTDEVYGFDIPVPALDEEFDVALIGTKGKWYDHKVCVSNPVDILTEVALRESGYPEERVIGSGTVLDTARLKYLISEELEIDSRNVHAFIVGEHGDSELAVWSCANIYGIPVEKFAELLSNNQALQIEK